MISELSELYGLTPRAIRYYEAAGLIDPTRDRLNRRRFDDRARQRLLLIARLRRAGLGIPAVREVLALEIEGLPAQLRLAAVKLGELRADLEHRISEIDGLLLDFEELWLPRGRLTQLATRSGSGRPGAISVATPGSARRIPELRASRCGASARAGS